MLEVGSLKYKYKRLVWFNTYTFIILNIKWHYVVRYKSKEKCITTEWLKY